MFNKKLALLFLVLLFIFNISFVSAVNCNQTSIVEIDDNNYEMSVINNSDEKNFAYEINNFEENSCDETIFNITQGDKIPINIDSSVDGNLSIFIDNKIYGLWNFSKNETILIPTYNPDSFYNDSIKNMGIGTHNLSLIFHLNTLNNYIPFVSDENFNLNFQFQKYDDNILNNNYTYVYISKFKINKKEKTIHISLLDKNPTYYSGIGFEVFMQLDDIDKDDGAWKDKQTYSFGIILSDKEGIIHKEDRYVGEDYFYLPQFDSNGLPCHNCIHSLFDIPGITHNVVRKLGVCNLTVINFADGTQDYVLFNFYKFYPDFDGISYIINETNVTFYFNCFYFPEGFISVDNIHKFFPHTINDFLNVTFVNLNPGFHVMTLDYPETDFSEQFFYQVIFKTNGSNYINNSPNSVNIVQSNVSLILFQDNVLIKGRAFLFSDCRTIIIQDNCVINNSNLNSSELDIGIGFKFYFESMSVSDDNLGGGSNEASFDVKSYEISKKSVFSSIDDLLTKLGLTFFSCMSFMIGYFKFGEDK